MWDRSTRQAAATRKHEQRQQRSRCLASRRDRRLAPQSCPHFAVAPALYNPAWAQGPVEGRCSAVWGPGAVATVSVGLAGAGEEGLSERESWEMHGVLFASLLLLLLLRVPS